MDEDDDMFGEGYFPDPDEDLTNFERVDDLDFDKEEIAEKPSVKVEPHVLVPVVVQVEAVTLVDLAPSYVPSKSVPDSNDFLSVNNSVYLPRRAPVIALESDQVSGPSFASLLAESIESVRVRDADLAAWIARQDRPATVVHHRQFIDKYKPIRFIDLLSDDSVNRQVLQWLSEWKKNLHTNNSFMTISPPSTLALPTPARIEEPAKVRMDRPHHSQWEGAGKKWIKDEASVPVSSPAVVFPNRKILLLGGAAGVGKSTLIEVCAKHHFNYSLIESSSADERGRTNMSKVITDVCQNRSVMDSTKPQLLLIEEIDGDECTAADLLVDLIHKHPELIKRPIICVCSDVWNKKLRNLREVATVITLPPPRGLRLAEKLKQICAAEHILIESMAIDRLVSLCECDIRACLNQLQALAARADTGETLTVQNVMKYCSGNSEFGQLKDTNKSELELMTLIFEPKRSRPDKYSELVNQAINAGKSLSVNLPDIFAHCLVTIPFTDFNLRYMSKLIELMSFENRSHASFGIAMKFASTFCPAVGKPRIDIFGARKVIATRFHSQTDRHGIVTALGKTALHSVAATRFINRTFAMYGSRLLVQILEPEHNAVWAKKSAFIHPEIRRIASIYAQFGLRLVEEGEELQLVPDLHALGGTPSAFAVGSLMGELLRGEAQTELLKQRAATDGAAELVAKGTKRKEIVEEHGQKSSRLNLSSWAGKTTAHHTDGSDVIIVKKFPFEFRFNEGHTNAVRRVLRLKDFRPVIHNI